MDDPPVSQPSRKCTKCSTGQIPVTDRYQRCEKCRKQDQQYKASRKTRDLQVADSAISAGNKRKRLVEDEGGIRDAPSDPSKGGSTSIQTSTEVGEEFDDTGNDPLPLVTVSNPCNSSFTLLADH